MVDESDEVVQVVLRGRWATGRIVRREGQQHGREVIVVKVADGEVRRFDDEIRYLGR